GGHSLLHRSLVLAFLTCRNRIANGALDVVGTVDNAVVPSGVRPDGIEGCDCRAKSWFRPLHLVLDSFKGIESDLRGVAFCLGRQVVGEPLCYFHSLAGMLVGQQGPDETTACTAKQPKFAGTGPFLQKELNPVTLRIFRNPLLNPLQLVHGLSPQMRSAVCRSTISLSLSPGGSSSGASRRRRPGCPETSRDRPSC